MHMADALLSPAVGATLWAASAGTLAWCSKHLRGDARDHLVPLMAVLGAFVFAGQMINFTIPGTGSSGHIGGGLLLAILLGGPAAFVVIASVLTVQALFFADGGLLALGANIFNLGVFPCLIAYPLIYRPLVRAAGASPSRNRLALITVLTTVIGLQLGALGVVIETQLSGISSLPLSTFLLLMQPIHLAIGLVEGLATAAIIAFVYGARPDLVAVDDTTTAGATASFPTRIVALFVALALATGGLFSWFASSHPDGLEWSIEQVTGKPEVEGEESAVHQWLARLQERIAPMPNYAFPASAEAAGEEEPAWPAVDAGTSTAGVLGGLGTLVLVMAIGFLLRPRRARTSG
ncbi:MAG: energy-coupling factor ABC transporter permease [Rhodocyclaceae bacterium]|jgi:cobalt/nickel transport system permease protein|nr:energy-coupling factor ABC transporter permease [Rhodocyclaceae bacterium]